MKEIVNTTSRPVTLQDGTILAAAGTEGSVKRVEHLSEADERRLSESIVVRDAEIEQPPAPKVIPSAPDAKEKK